MTQWLLLTVGLGVSPGIDQIGFQVATLARILPLGEDAVFALNEDTVVFHLKTGDTRLTDIQGVKTYDPRGRLLTPTHARKRLRPDTLVLFSTKGTRFAWSDLWIDLLFLPKDTLIVIEDDPRFAATAFREARFRGSDEPVSFMEVIEHALIDRPKELLQFTHKATLDAIEPLITAGFYSAPAQTTRR